MNQNIKVWKFVFDNKNSKQVLTPFEKKLWAYGSKKIIITTLEMEVSNPSDLIITFRTQVQGSDNISPMYLFLSRHLMLFQDGKYILKTDDIKLDIMLAQYDIEVLSESNLPFKLTAYYYCV